MSNRETVLDIIAAKGMIDRSKLADEARLTELGISSLDVVEIVFALEDKFNISIPFNANATKLEFETIGEVIAAVEKLVAEKAA